MKRKSAALFCKDFTNIAHFKQIILKSVKQGKGSHYEFML